jgi:transposase-like protein
MARTKLTEATQRIICAAIAEGNYFAVACRLAGIAPETGYAWLRRGEYRHKSRGCTPAFAAFAEAVRQAEAACESAKVREAYQKSSAMEFLARRFPDRWGRKERLEAEEGGRLRLEVIEVRLAGERDEQGAERDEQGAFGEAGESAAVSSA